jgi:hypothetical protein
MTNIEEWILDCRDGLLFHGTEKEMDKIIFQRGGCFHIFNHAPTQQEIDSVLHDYLYN